MFCQESSCLTPNILQSVGIIRVCSPHVGHSRTLNIQVLIIDVEVIVIVVVVIIIVVVIIVVVIVDVVIVVDVYYEIYC